MSNFPSPLGTTQQAIPAVPPTQIGRYAGLKMHFPILSDGVGDAAGSTSLVSAVIQERANITASTPIWSANQPMTVATEPFGCERVWTVGASASLSHARKVLIRTGLTVTLASDTNAVTTLASGATPTGGVAGDLAIDFAGNAYWLNSAGTWITQGAIYSFADAAATTAALATKISVLSAFPTLSAGANAWVNSTMANRIGSVNLSSAVSLTMNNTGAVHGDSAFIMNIGTGTLSATGVLVGSGFTSSVGQYGNLSMQYDSTANSGSGGWVSTTQSASGAQLTATASVLNASPSTLTIALSAAGWQGTLPSFGTVTVTKNGSAFNPTAWSWASSGIINATLPGSVVASDTLLWSYTENTTARIQSLLGSSALQTFAAATVVNSVAIAAPVFTVQTAPTTATVGATYSGQFTANNTSSYGVISGALPTGTSLNTVTGAITGTVTAAGSFTFTIRATGPTSLTTNATSVTVVASAPSTALAFATAPTLSGTIDIDNYTLGGVVATDWAYLANYNHYYGKGGTTNGGGPTFPGTGPYTKSYTANGTDSVNGFTGIAVTSASNGITASGGQACKGTLTAGTAIYNEYAVTGFTAGVALTLVLVSGTYNATTTANVVASVDDGSATTVSSALSANGTTQVRLVHFTPGANTTLRLRTTSPNADGDDQVFTGFLMIFPGTL